jgi:flagellar protein FliJ
VNRFRFRLESVLRVRIAEETKKQRDFGVALHNVRNAEDGLRKIIEEIDANDRLTEDRERGATNAADLRSLSEYSRALERKRDAQRKVLERLEETLRQKRGELLEATRRRKTLERLRERALIEYNETVRKEEGALIDEIAVRKYARSLTAPKPPE